MEDHRAPTVASMVWYKAGSMDELSGATGVAHVLEHMMFKGTPTLKPGEFSRRVAALGGRDVWVVVAGRALVGDILRAEGRRVAGPAPSDEDVGLPEGTRARPVDDTEARAADIGPGRVASPVDGDCSTGPVGPESPFRPVPPRTSRSCCTANRLVEP